MKENVSYCQTPYAGVEDQVLRLRNKNRPDERDSGYMAWRYAHADTSAAPVIFWACDKNCKHVGMAGLTFRSFWVDNQPSTFAILGDIALDKEYRGTGVAKQLFQFMNAYIQKAAISCSLVIPNIAAEKSLAAADWMIVESLVPHVFMLDPTEKIRKLLKIRLVASLLGKTIRSLVRAKLVRDNLDDYGMETLHAFDESFESFWQAFPKQRMIVGERSLAYLRWRYEKHPSSTYVVCKFIYKSKFIGYIVHTISEGSRSCVIYELMASDQKHIKPMCYVFLRNILKAQNEVNSVRITLNESHPYAALLSRLGFVRRESAVKLQVYSHSKTRFADNARWYITAGDKNV